MLYKFRVHGAENSKISVIPSVLATESHQSRSVEFVFVSFTIILVKCFRH